MEVLLNILGRLGIDGTVFSQFFAVLILFIVAKYLFYNKLQAIIERRHQQTTGLESQADAELERVEALKEEYENKISGARLKAQRDFTMAKKEVSKKLDEKYDERVQIVEKRIDEARLKTEEEVASQKESLMGEAQSLAHDLLKKILH